MPTLLQIQQFLLNPNLLINLTISSITILLGLLIGLIVVKVKRRNFIKGANKTSETEKLDKSIKELQDSQNLLAATLAIALLKK